MVRGPQFEKRCCREYHNTRFMINIFENRAVYEIIWKDIVEPASPQMTIWRMRITCWIHKATTRTHNV